MIDESWYEENANPTTEWEVYARDFVRLLIDANYDAAYSCLSSTQQAQLEKATFIRRFQDIVSTEDVPLSSAWVIMSMTGYPDMAKDEIGMAYVHVGGDNNEAMTVFVSSDNGRYSVGNLEWGRP